MVMRNRDEGSQAPHWWDDLPPKVRHRFTAPVSQAEEAPSGKAEPLPALSRGQLLLDLSLLATMFVLVTIGILLLLLVALSFLNS